MRAPMWFLAVFGGMGAFVGAVSGATPDTSATSSGTAPADPQVLTDAVAAALRCELEGNDVDRNALLRHVLDEDPEFAPAHWHLGDLKVNGATWVPYDQFADKQDERWHQLYLYRKNREERKDTVDDQLYMADGARDRRMWDEERAHLTRVLQLDWNNTEAHERLGHRRIGAQWVSAEQLQQVTQDSERWRASLQEWTPRIEELLHRMGLRSPEVRQAAEAELFAIRDPAAIPAMELLFARQDEAHMLRYLDWLAGTDAWEGSVALARQSVLSDSTSVRIRARDLMQARRLEDYVPSLLGALRVDDARTERFLTWDGRFVFVYIESYERQEAAYQRVAMVSYVPVVTLHMVQIGRGGPLQLQELLGVEGYFNNERYRAAADRDLNDRRRYSTRSIAQATQSQSLLNARVIRSLQQVTGRELDEPADWWDWWIAHNQVYATGKKPSVEDGYEEEWYVQNGRRRRRRPHPGPEVKVVVTTVGGVRGSCFAAGTPVVTEYGPKPIEAIVLGDRVLAQDVETGQIAFKPVFDTTVRPPVHLLKVTTDDGELLCTGGHPFWINGLGWRYACELEPGMWFHSVDGSCEIVSVEDSGRSQKAYNLVVADYHDYFVGDGRILAHDNSPRDPTNALVPGLMPDWSAPVDENK